MIADKVEIRGVNFDVDALLISKTEQQNYL